MTEKGLLDLARAVARRLVQAVRPESQPVDVLMRRMLDAVPDLTFIQVGANAGDFEDPIAPLIHAHPKWRGVFVEPVPFAFRRLRRNYGEDPRFTFVNAAVSVTPTTQPFYYVAEHALTQLPDLPPWYDQLGSFDRDHITRHFGARIEPYIVAAKVPCLTLAEVFARLGDHPPDLLHVDTEGFDAAVVAQVRHPLRAPLLILYEHKHLAPGAARETRRHLERLGYRLRECRGDTLAVHRRWRQRARE